MRQRMLFENSDTKTCNEENYFKYTITCPTFQIVHFIEERIYHVLNFSIKTLIYNFSEDATVLDPPVKTFLNYSFFAVMQNHFAFTKTRYSIPFFFCYFLYEFFKFVRIFTLSSTSVIKIS